MKRRRILLSAYACEPGKGSEQEVGWKWALHLARHCDVTVATRSNNRESIAHASRTEPMADRIQWIYHDLDGAWLRAKRRFRMHRAYYRAWQRSLSGVLARLPAFDLAHHLTFASYRYPTAIAGLPCPKIWGPVGGAEMTPWRLFPWNHPTTLLHEAVRNLSTSSARGLSQARDFDLILASTQETRDLLASRGFSADVLPTIGMDRSAIPDDQPRITVPGVLRLLFVGNLLHLKGVHFAIAAMADTPSGVSLTVAGSGPYAASLHDLARRNGTADRVHFIGRVPHHEISALYRRHDVFLFPSLHDSGGIALMEAMAAGMPSIVLRRGGPQIITSPECAIQITASSKAGIVAGISGAIHRYAADEAMRNAHGRAARERVIAQFLWENKAEAMVRLYEQVLHPH